MGVPGLRSNTTVQVASTAEVLHSPGGQKFEVKVAPSEAVRGSLPGLFLSFWCFANNLQHPHLHRHCESLCVQTPRFRRTVRGDLEPPYSSLPSANYLCSSLIPKFGHIPRCWGLECERLNFSGEVSFQPVTPGDPGLGHSARELALSTTCNYGLGGVPASSVEGWCPRTAWYVDGEARLRPVA